MNNDILARKEGLTTTVIDIAIRIGVIAVMVGWCFQIVRPFISVILWGIIIAVTLNPVYGRLVEWIGGRHGLMAFLMSVLMLLVIIVPAIYLGNLVVENSHVVAGHLKEGMITVPPPPESLLQWPLIGRHIHNFWLLASSNLGSALELVSPQIKQFGGWLLSAAASTGLAVLQFIFSIIIAGLLLARNEAGNAMAQAVMKRFVGIRGPDLNRLAVATIRGVASGVLGVALIQSILAGLGFVVAGVPGAGLLAVLCLFLAVIQLGAGLVVFPVAIYVFSTHSGLFASIFLVWSIFVALMDNVLKPLMMGRGVQIPMLVIFLGAIGGMMLSGIIGLFVGAVVLALGYELFQQWLRSEPAMGG